MLMNNAISNCSVRCFHLDSITFGIDKHCSTSSCLVYSVVIPIFDLSIVRVCASVFSVLKYWIVFNFKPMDFVSVSRCFYSFCINKSMEVYVWWNRNHADTLNPTFCSINDSIDLDKHPVLRRIHHRIKNA